MTQSTEQFDPQEDPQPTNPSDQGGLLLYWLVVVPCLVLRDIAFFVLEYFRGRPWFFLPLAWPAILGFLLALYVTAWILVVPDSRVVTVLEATVAKAQANRDWARVRVGLQAILERKPDSQQHQFAFAQLLREEGDIRSAAAMIVRLAPLDRVGYPPAHLLLAEEAIARYENAGPQDDRQQLLKQAIHHLDAAASARDSRWEYQLGVLYVDRGDMTLAELHLEQAATGGYSVADLLLSQLERQRGNGAAAEQHRQAASKGLQTYIQQHPEDLEARLAWGRCLLDGGEWVALDSLLAYLRREGTDRPFRNRLGQLHLTAAEQYPQETQEMRQTVAGYAERAFDLLEEKSAAVWPLLQLAGTPGTVGRDCLVRIQQWYDQTSAGQPAQAGRLLIGAGLAEALGNLTQAEANYQAAVRCESLAVPELAAFYRRQGDAVKLAKTNTAIIRQFQARLQQSPGDARVSIVLAQAYAGESRWEDARKVLAAVSEGRDVRAAQAALCVDQFDATFSSSAAASTTSQPAPSQPAPSANAGLPPARETAVFGLLLQALQAVPNYPPAVQRFRSALLNESPAVAQRVQDYVTGLLAEGKQLAVMHYLLGVRAYALQRWVDAIQHLEQAQRLRPFDANVQHQLARALLRGAASDESLKRSAALVQAGLHRWPNHPELLATNGEIRLRQGDFAGAVSDLELAISRLPSHAALHRLLADAYERLGNPQLSQRHRELAAQDERTKN